MAESGNSQSHSALCQAFQMWLISKRITWQHSLHRYDSAQNELFTLKAEQWLNLIMATSHSVSFAKHCRYGSSQNELRGNLVTVQSKVYPHNAGVGGVGGKGGGGVGGKEENKTESHFQVRSKIPIKFENGNMEVFLNQISNREQILRPDAGIPKKWKNNSREPGPPTLPRPPSACKRSNHPTHGSVRRTLDQSAAARIAIVSPDTQSAKNRITYMPAGNKEFFPN